MFDRNTIIHTNSSVLYAYGAAMSGLVYTNNISQHHRYGIMGDGATTGIPTITRYFPGATVRCNVLAGGSASLYPTPNAFPSVTAWNASFVNAGAGDYRLIPGSPVASGGCSGAIPGADVAKLNDARRRGLRPRRRRRPTRRRRRHRRRRTSRRWRMPAVRTRRP